MATKRFKAWSAVEGFAVIRSLLGFQALQIVKTEALAGLTDSTGGTNNAGVLVAVAVPAPTSFAHVTGSDCETSAAFNTSLGKIANANRVIGTYLNGPLALLGLPLVTFTDGTVAVAGTVPAQDLTGTGSSGAGAVVFTDSLREIVKQRNNLAVLVRAFNDVLAAMQVARLADNTGGSVTPALPTPGVMTVAPGTAYTGQSGTTSAGIVAPGANVPPNFPGVGAANFGEVRALAAVVNTGVDAGAGTATLSLAAATSFLAGYANNLASLSAAINTALGTTGSPLVLPAPGYVNSD